jgi:hypothetical protein
MAIEVTLQLPESLVEHAKRFGEATQRDVGYEKLSSIYS